MRQVTPLTTLHSIGAPGASKVFVHMNMKFSPRIRLQVVFTSALLLAVSVSAKAQPSDSSSALPDAPQAQINP